MNRNLLTTTLVFAAALLGCSGEDLADSEVVAEATDTPAAPEILAEPVAPTESEAEQAIQVAEAAEPTETAEDVESDASVTIAHQPRGVVVATLDDIENFFASNDDHVIVMNFWATWCKPCIHEMPALAEFDREYRDKGVAFLSLSTDSADDIETKLIPYVSEEDLPFTVYAIANLDPEQLQPVLTVDMDFGLPTTFVLDKNREVAKVWMRNIEKSDLVEVVEPLL